MLRSGQLPRCIVVALSFLVSAGRAAVAQTTTGKIEGVVRDTSGDPLPGVTVEATSPSLQGSRSATTLADGAFRFPAIPPGTYEVRATLSGFRVAEKTAKVSLDATATVDLKLQLAAEEQVVVSGEAPLIDSTSTTTGTNYTSNVIAHLPVSRNYADIVKSNPGVSTDRGSTRGTFHRPDDLRCDFRREPVDHRRRQHDQRPEGGPGQGPQQRVRAGGRGQDGRVPGGVRPGARRCRQRHHQIGRQHASWRRIRLLRLDEHRGRAAVRAGRLGHRADAGDRWRAVRLRRGPRRVHRQRPSLVLRRVQPRQSSGPPRPASSRLPTYRVPPGSRSTRWAISIRES